MRSGQSRSKMYFSKASASTWEGSGSKEGRKGRKEEKRREQERKGERDDSYGEPSWLAN